MKDWIDFLTRNVIIRFIIAGGTSACVDLCALYILHNIWGMHYLFSAVLAFLIAFSVSFTLHKFWTFKSHTEEIHKQAGLYLLASFFGLGLNTVLMYVFVDGLHLHVILSQIFVGALVACFSFSISRKFVFKYKKPLLEDRNRKIRVIIGVTSLGVGGIEKQLVNQLQFFDRSIFEIHVVSIFNTRFNMENVPNLYAEVSKYAHLHKLDFKNSLDVRSWFEFLTLMKKIMPDVVMTSMFSANTVFRMAQPLYGYKVIACEHNTYSDRKIYHRVIDHVLSYVSYKIVAVSAGVKEYIIKETWVRKNKVQVIYNGIDLEKIKKYTTTHCDGVLEIKKSLGFSPDEKIILHIGRLKSQKNQKLLIDAFDLFSKDHLGYTLVIVGQGNEKKNLEHEIREKNLDHKVKMFGYREDVHDFYLASDFFVLSSRIEGFALVGIEAMAFGLPVISTRVAGPVEYVKDGKNGYLANSTPVDMASKMSHVASLSPNDRFSFKENALITAENFSLQKSVAEYEELFLEAFKTT